MFTTVFIEYTTSIRLKELWDFFMKTIMYNKYTQNLYGLYRQRANMNGIDSLETHGVHLWFRSHTCTCNNILGYLKKLCATLRWIEFDN